MIEDIKLKEFLDKMDTIFQIAKRENLILIDDGYRCENYDRDQLYTTNDMVLLDSDSHGSFILADIVKSVCAVVFRSIDFYTRIPEDSSVIKAFRELIND